MSAQDTTKIAKLKEVIGSIWDALTVEQLLKARERMKLLHAEQMSEINAVLTKKGYVEPHMENVRTLSSE